MFVCVCVCVCVCGYQAKARFFIIIIIIIILFGPVRFRFKSKNKTKRKIHSNQVQFRYANIHKHTQWANITTKKRKNILDAATGQCIYGVSVPKNEFRNWKQYWMNEWCKLYKSESLEMSCYILDFHWTSWMCFLF